MYIFFSFGIQYQELLAQYEKKQKDLKNLCVEESQQKRALAMRLDKESKQNIRRQKKREMKEQHVQDVMGYLTIQYTVCTTAVSVVQKQVLSTSCICNAPR